MAMGYIMAVLIILAMIIGFEPLVNHVLQFFKDHGFAGFEVLPGTVRFAGTSRQPPAFWEFVATAAAGLISPESGYSVLGICPGWVRSSLNTFFQTHSNQKLIWKVFAGPGQLP
jgi:hypothetical protein